MKELNCDLCGGVFSDRELYIYQLGKYCTKCRAKVRRESKKVQEKSPEERYRGRVRKRVLG